MAEDSTFDAFRDEAPKPDPVEDPAPDPPQADPPEVPEPEDPAPEVHVSVADDFEADGTVTVSVAGFPDVELPADVSAEHAKALEVVPAVQVGD